MPQFNVGDTVVVTSLRRQFPEYTLKLGAVYVVQEFTMGREPCVILEEIGGSWTVDQFTLQSEANPNLITVSSLDYMSSTTLTDEDKEMIKEHLAYA